jgi:hypothetical protein
MTRAARALRRLGLGGGGGGGAPLPARSAVGGRRSGAEVSAGGEKAPAGPTPQRRATGRRRRRGRRGSGEDLICFRSFVGYYVHSQIVGKVQVWKSATFNRVISTHTLARDSYARRGKK